MDTKMILEPFLSSDKQIELFRNFNAENREKLILTNLLLAAKLARRYQKVFSEISFDDMFSDAYALLIAAVDNYRFINNYAKFSTYATKCIYLGLKETIVARTSLISITFKARKHIKYTFTTDVDIYELRNFIEDYDTKDFVNALLSKLSDKDVEIMILHFGLDGRPPLEAKALGQKLGVSHKTAWRATIRILKILRKEIEDGRYF